MIAYIAKSTNRVVFNSYQRHSSMRAPFPMAANFPPNVRLDSKRSSISS